MIGCLKFENKKSKRKFRFVILKYINNGWSSIGNLYADIVSACQPNPLHSLEGGEKGMNVLLQ